MSRSKKVMSALHGHPFKSRGPSQSSVSRLSTVSLHRGVELGRTRTLASRVVNLNPDLILLAVFLVEGTELLWALLSLFLK